jgi:8-oxo-dGTP pyrophosphatase MutT (NUDIX family)
MENKEKKVISKNKYFNVIEEEGMFGIEPVDLCVVVLPFERDTKGLPKALGVLKEYNPMRDGNYSITLVTGRAEGEDPDVLSTAIRELKEESGYDVPDPEKWYYLGMMTGSKLVKQDHPCFAVDITGMEPGVKEGDGTKSEAKSEFLKLSVKEALNTNDCFVPTLFLKIFQYIFGFNMGQAPDNTEVEPAEMVHKLKKKLDITYLSIDGVNGSIVRHTLQGDPYIEYTVREITDDIKKIPSQVDGVDIVVKIAESQIQQ